MNYSERKSAPSKSGCSSRDKGRLGSRCACGQGRGRQLLRPAQRRLPAPAGGGQGRSQGGSSAGGRQRLRGPIVLPAPAQAWRTLL